MDFWSIEIEDKIDIARAREILMSDAYDWADNSDNSFSWNEYNRLRDAPDKDFTLEEGFIDHPILEEPLDVDEKDDTNAKIARLIREGYTCGYEPHWTLSAKGMQISNLIDEDREHIAQKVAQGYTSGEIIAKER